MQPVVKHFQQSGKVVQYNNSSKSVMFLQHYLIPLFMSVLMLHNERAKKKKRKTGKKNPLLVSSWVLCQLFQLAALLKLL